MKRSEINAAIHLAKETFAKTGWTLPPNPRWDVTDLGLGRFKETGLVLVNLAEEPEYCEKLMLSCRDQVTPMHCHKRKKEDIVCRAGKLACEVWAGHPETTERGALFSMKRNGAPVEVGSGDILHLAAGERVTLEPGVYHAFWAETDTCVIGEVSTANDDLHDNFFVDPDIGRFPGIEEDEPALVRLVSEG